MEENRLKIIRSLIWAWADLGKKDKIETILIYCKKQKIEIPNKWWWL